MDCAKNMYIMVNKETLTEASHAEYIAGRPKVQAQSGNFRSTVSTIVLIYTNLCQDSRASKFWMVWLDSLPSRNFNHWMNADVQPGCCLGRMYIALFLTMMWYPSGTRASVKLPNFFNSSRNIFKQNRSLVALRKVGDWVLVGIENKANRGSNNLILLWLWSHMRYGRTLTSKCLFVLVDWKSRTRVVLSRASWYALWSVKCWVSFEYTCSFLIIIYQGNNHVR